MHARVHDLLRHHNAVGISLGAGDGLRRADRIAGLPGLVTVNIGDAVVGLALVVADDRCARIHRALGIHDRLEWFVVDVDELDGVLRDVPRLGDDVCDLLALEADLVGGEHRLGVVRQGWHPGEVVTEQARARDALEILASQYGNDTGQGQGRRGIDGLDAGVRPGAAQDGTVEHAGEIDVVDVVALAPDEALILDTLHAAESDGVAPGTDWHFLDSGHADTSFSAG